MNLKRRNLFRMLFPLVILVFILNGCGNNETNTSNTLSHDIKTIKTDSVSSSPLNLYIKQISRPMEEPSKEENKEDNKEEENKEQQNIEQEPIPSISLLMVGDNLVHEQVIKSGKNEDGSYNYDHLFQNLKEDIEGADIAVINQETILGGNLFPYTGYPTFNTPTEMGDAIRLAGFDVVLHATNHTMDKGYKAVANTLEYWKRYPNITVAGINESKEKRDTITTIAMNGINVAFLNYTYSLNGYSLPKDKPYLVNMLDENEVINDIRKAKKISDFVIVFPHWGTEYVYEPDDYQKKWTKLFSKEEVDLVIGTHPHVIQPIEWITSETGHKMLVFYSLGNYVSYQKEAPRMLGGMANITLTKDNDKVYITESSITPIVTHYENKGDYHYGVYKLNEYTLAQSLVHGVIKLQKSSSFSLAGTTELAKKVLKEWYK